MRLFNCKYKRCSDARFIKKDEDQIIKLTPQMIQRKKNRFEIIHKHQNHFQDFILIIKISKSLILLEKCEKW